jgi:hypothetical protein
MDLGSHLGNVLARMELAQSQTPQYDGATPLDAPAINLTERSLADIR